MNIFSLAKLFAKRQAIRIALKRPPATNDDIFKELPPDSDQVFVYLHDQDGKKRFIVQGLEKDGVVGLWFNDHEQSGERRTLGNADVANMEISLLQIYGNARFNYTTASSFILGLWTLYPVREVRRDRIEQRRFNRTELIRADRMRLLEHFLKKTIEKPDYSPSVVSLMADLYTLRSMDHPRYNETEQYHELLLNSLVQSGELQMNSVSYSMTDRTIPSLENLQGQKERHDDNIRQQRRIGWLTASLIGVAAIQAVITVWTELHVDPLP